MSPTNPNLGGKQFAFKVSLVDMIRKLRYRYDYPIDYLDTFVNQLYLPGAKVDFDISAESIKLESDSCLSDDFISEVSSGSLLSLASIIPPIPDYQTITITSKNKKITIDSKRNISLEDCISEVYEGSFSEASESPLYKTEVVIRRNKPVAKRVIESEKDRLKSIYNNSDLQVTIDREKDSLTRINPESSYHFESEGISGYIQYNPRSSGGIHYFNRGRFISSESYLSGIDIFVHGSGLVPTITKSKIITKGRGKEAYQHLNLVLSQEILGYLSSTLIQDMRRESPNSYLTILSSIHTRFKDDPKFKELFESLGKKERESLQYQEVNGVPKYLSRRRLVGALFSAGLLVAGYGMFSEPVNDYGGSSTTRSTKDQDAQFEKTNQSSEEKESVYVGHDLTTDKQNLRISGALDKNQLIRALMSSDGSNKYILSNTFNTLYCGPANYYLGKKNNLNLEVNRNCYVDMPDEISEKVNRHSSFEEKLKVVAEYIQDNFEYDLIELPQIKKYGTLMEATSKEHKGVCRDTNLYAAVLLSELGVYDKIRIASGTRSGVSHLWLEKNTGTDAEPKWEIYDNTAERMNSDLLQKYMEEVPASKFMDNTISGLTDILKENPVELAKKMFDADPQSEISFLLHNPIAYLGSGGIQLALFSLLGLIGVGGYFMVKSGSRALTRRRNPLTISRNVDPEDYQRSLQIRDLLEVKRVLPYNQPTISYNAIHDCILVPEDYFKAFSVDQIALKAVPTLGLSGRKERIMYQNISDKLTR